MGFCEIALGVDLGNAPARTLYAKKGFDILLYEGEDELGPFQKWMKRL